MTKRKGGRAAVENRRARRNYSIEDTLEAGLMLLGSEVKSLREGRASLAEAWAGPKDNGLYLQNCHIPPYEQAGHQNHAPRRPRKMLVHKKELVKLHDAVKRDGMTLVPLKIYFNDRGIAKLLIGVAKGRKKHDKRQSDKERDWKRQKARLMRDKG